MAYQQHPLGAAFPAMQADEYQALHDSIMEIGVQNPITLLDGMVIDGWHRYTAANELGLDCPVVELGDVDPRDFVLAQNKARRHITVAQLAMAANAVYQWRAAGRPSTNSAGPAELKQSDIAEKTGVSVRSLRQANKVAKDAAPEVAEAVKSGAVGLEKAVAIAKLPKEEQAAAIAKPIAKKPEQLPEPEVPEYYGPSDEEIRAAQMQQQADEAIFNKLLLEDDKLSTAYAEIKRLNAVNAALEARLQGLMNEKAEAIRLCKSLQRKVDKLEKVAA